MMKPSIVSTSSGWRTYMLSSHKPMKPPTAPIGTVTMTTNG
jgi:hypothetical protein